MFILEIVLVLVAMIILHELGHFLACRLFNVDVEEFGVGFPPRLTRLFTWRGTEFTLNWIPLGGFVRPKGENDPQIQGGLAAANPFVRIGVYLAGPMMNILTAIILYTLVFSRMGMPDPDRLDVVLINDVSLGSPAEAAGVLVGDEVLKVGDEVIDSTAELREVIYANLGQPLTFFLQRGDQTFETVVTPRENPSPEEGAIGILMGTPIKVITLNQALPMGLQATYDHSVALLTLIGRLVTGTSDPQEGRLVGYKGMVDIWSGIRAGEQTSGYPPAVSEMLFVVNISISLGLLNLLPVPALDGGRIAFTLPEIILRRRIPPNWENVINLVSFALLIVLLIVINLQDFTNPVTIP